VVTGIYVYVCMRVCILVCVFCACVCAFLTSRFFSKHIFSGTTIFKISES